MTEEKRISPIGTAAIMCLFLVSMGFTVVTPAMATLGAHYAGKDVTWISTLPTLFTVIATALAGSVMGKKVKYRTLAIAAGVLYLIGGCAPALFDNYAGMLVCRAILGFGLGLMAPLGNALIVGNYKGQKQASLLGYGTLFMNGGGIILQMLGGALAEMNWQLVFWGHAFGLIGLVMAFFLPEPDAPAAVPEAASAGKKEKMGKAVWLIAILFIVFNILNYPIMLNISTLFEIRNAGGATVAATGLSLYTVAGCVAGLIFGTLFKFAKRWCIALGYILCGLGALCIYVGQNAAIMTLGLILIGFGFSTVMPAFFAWVGVVTPASTVAGAISICMAVMNLGGFVSSFWLKLLTAIFGENILSGIMIEIVVFLIIGVIFLIYSPFKEKKQA
ncbi:MAG TPA: MFS transporter [Candidatus Scatomonas pullistercoris]|uniref:MFS transporter n=1 Tax=Candidatus Scatomonas pullistercoris TaxID=2840920 RepID=A0A9D1TAE0_9FIRM|nr:MFS transporter [Candidatus Scatomonas pullistercoris]